MAGSVNKVILVGNLGADPDSRALPSGGKVVSLSIATSQSWNDRQTGERRERTEWHRVVIFNERLGEVAEKYLSKGRSVYLEGELRTRKWTDQSGQDKYTTEVVIDRFRGELVLLGGNGQGGGGSSTSSGSGGNSRAGRSSGGYGAGQREAQGAPAGSGWDSRPDNSLDDEIPF